MTVAPGQATARRGRTRDVRKRAAQKVALAVGFGFLLLGVYGAYTDPATSYELSIYRSTPRLYWLGLAGSFLVSLVVFATGPASRWLTYGAFLLAYASGLALLGLPLLRGYYFVGASDSLTHLGWVRDIEMGSLDPSRFLYPGLHLLSLWVATLFGIELTYAVQVAVLVFFAVFLLFVPLCVKRLTGGTDGLLVGVFAAVLWLPVTNFGVYPMAHAFSQAVLFSPFVWYVLLVSLEATEEFDISHTPLASALLTVAVVTAILVHPQFALGIVLMLVMVGALQAVCRLSWPDHPVASHRSVRWPAVVSGTFYLVWTAKEPVVRRTLTTVVTSLFEVSQVGNEVAQRSSSVSAVGQRVEVLAFKLLFPAAVFAVLAGLLALRTLSTVLEEDHPPRDALVNYLVLGALPTAGLVVVFFVASVSKFYSRYAGGALVVVTVLGAVAVVRLTRTLAGRVSAVPARTVVAVMFAVLVPLAAMTVFYSPFILRSSPHVTEQRVAGHEQAFETADPRVDYVGIRTGPVRFRHGTAGTELSERRVATDRFEEGVPPVVFDTNLTSHYTEPRYLPVSQTERQAEVDLYGGFRYSQRGFDALDSTPGIDRVQTNGEFQVYYLRGAAE